MEPPPMKQNVELLASYWTLAVGAEPHTEHEYSTFDFRDRVEAAARAGFKGFGIWDADLYHTLQRRSLNEMKQILNDNGVKHIELEFLRDWFRDGGEKKQSDLEKKKLFEAAGALNAHHLKVGDFERKITPMAHLIESFGALCADAAEQGITIGFEVMPFAMIDTLKDSVTMVEGAAARNGGIILDLWHLAKMRVPYDEIARIPTKYLVSVELNDGTFEAPWSLHEDTINHRRFCGEGEFDVKGFIDSVRSAGYTGPFGIEVLSQELRKKPLEEIVTRAFQTTIAQFQD